MPNFLIYLFGLLSFRLTATEFLSTETDTPSLDSQTKVQDPQTSDTADLPLSATPHIPASTTSVTAQTDNSHSAAQTSTSNTLTQEAPTTDAANNPDTHNIDQMVMGVVETDIHVTTHEQPAAMLHVETTHTDTSDPIVSLSTSAPAPADDQSMPMEHVEADHMHHIDQSGQTFPVASESGDARPDQAEIDNYLAQLFAMDEAHAHGDDSSMHAEHMAALSLVTRSESTKVAIGSGDWFDPSIWADGEIPGDDDRILIPEGINITYGNISDAEFFTIRVDGTLSFATDQDSQMIFDTVVVSPTGTLEIGTEETPVDPSVNIDLIVAANGPIDTDWDPQLLSRGLISHGRTEIHGMEKDSHEKVLDDPMAGDTFVTFAEAPEGWQVGDTIVIAGTTYDGYSKATNDVESTFLGSQDEVRQITAIDGNRISFDEPLLYDHDTPRDDLKTSVANYTRNVSFESEDADTLDVSERGHVMFMHSDNVEVRYAEFDELGRTDKSLAAFDASDFATILSDSNVKGRYALHIHRAGTEEDDSPVVLEGNAVFGSPGWGIVHHDSHAILENNATYNTFGAGIVSESGNETGIWTDNIAILAPGIDGLAPKQAATNDKIAEFDLANSGDGFWLQSRLIEVTDNVAASVNTGFNYFHRGAYIDDGGGQIQHSADDFIFPEAVYYDETLESIISPILVSSGNETFAANMGLYVLKGNPDQGHDVRSTIEDFTAWSVRDGIQLHYTSHYTLNNIDLIGREDAQDWQIETAKTGITMRADASDIVINDSSIANFETGIDLFKLLRNEDEGRDELHQFFVTNTDISGSVTSDYANYDPSLDTILDSVTSKTPTLELDLGLKLVPYETFVISGTKTDSLGETTFPNGTDSFDLHPFDTKKLLEENGYYEASDGHKYMTLNVYFSDRYTAETYSQVEIIQLDDNFEWADQYYSQFKSTTVDIEDLQALADTKAVKVLDSFDSGTEILGSTAEFDDLWQALTGDQKTIEEGEVMSMPDATHDTHNHDIDLI